MPADRRNGGGGHAAAVKARAPGRGRVPHRAANVVAHLVARATETPNDEVFSFEDGRGILAISAADLLARTLSAASHLRSQAAAGDRVMLALPPGFDYIAGLLGCFAAGMVAVPAYPPRSRRQRTFFQAICGDARPTLALVEEEDAAAVLQAAQALGLAGLRAATPAVAQSCGQLDAREIETSPDRLALLQYTSGSTGRPKGVMLRHHALTANLDRQRALYGVRPGTRGVIWLPPYHDMGLGSGILQPLHSRSSVRLMTPAYAMQQPLRWLRAISTTRAHVSGAPPSAFGACVAAAEQGDDLGPLDLSAWRCAFVGAEPVGASVLDAFARRFAPYGFRRDAFQPSYGLAEATLLVAGRRRGDGLQVDEAGRVGCGRCVPGHRLRIVDPSTRQPAPTGGEGEVWLRGPSLADGYWGQPAATRATFGARLARGRASWLRTGDLGRIADGELWITGRLKDVLIFAGRKVHAGDIERTVAAAAGGARAPAAVAALGVSVDATERLILLVERRADRNGGDDARDDLRTDIVSAVSRDHAIGVHELRFLPAGALPRTTSGKIRRAACAEILAGAADHAHPHPLREARP